MEEVLAAFVGGLLGATWGPLLMRYVIAPLANRAEHKRLLSRERFRQEWGRNPLAFFLRHGGAGRGR
jgi:hypothetical protein